MALRKSLLWRQIQHATDHPRAPWLLALSVLASLPITPLYAADTHNQWSCKPSANGQDWDCAESTVSGQSYERPSHPSDRAHQSDNKSAGTSDRSDLRTPKGKLTAAQTDWVEWESLSKTQRDQRRSGCCGAYVAPVRSDSEANLNPSDAPLRAEADSSEWVQESKAALAGNVQLTQGYRHIRADQASLDQADNATELSGAIHLREPGVLVTGEQAIISGKTHSSTIKGASYVMHNSGLRGDARRINIDSNNVMVLEGGTVTYCEPDSNTWMIRTSELTLDPNTEQGVGKHVTLNVKGVPVLYTPYIRFPISDKRQSGFLFPAMSSSSDNGFDLSVPYYLNLAPNYDMTLAPRHISERGEMLETEVRHLSSQFATEVNLAYLANDSGGSDATTDDLIRQGIITQEQGYPHKGDERWLVGVKQHGGLTSRWYSGIDYTRASDEDYFRDLDSAPMELKRATHLQQTGVLGYRADHWLYEIKATEFQSLSSTATEQYKQLPRINVNGDYLLARDWLLTLDHEAVSFDHNEKDRDRLITGDRVRADYALTWDKEWLWGFFKPSAKMKSLHYQLDSEYLRSGANDSPSFTVPQATLDSGLYFERGAGDYLQTLEPRLFYFYSQRTNQDDLINVGTGTNSTINFDTSELDFRYSQLFRDSRFVGGDRIDDANQMTLDLTTRFIDEQTGIERFSASAGRIFYFEDRAVDLIWTEQQALSQWENERSDSAFAAQFSAQLSRSLRANADLTWDQQNADKVDFGSATLRYLDDQGVLLNLSYRFSRRAPLTSDPFDMDGDGDLSDTISQTIEQSDVSFAFPLYGNWSLIGRSNYDFTHGRELENLFGVEYNSCCYRTRLVVRQWLDNDLSSNLQTLDREKDQGIFLEFVLKGLGSVGNKLSNTLNESIEGYNQRENLFR